MSQSRASGSTRPHSRLSSLNEREREREATRERPPSSASLRATTSTSIHNPKTPKPSATRLGGLHERDIHKITNSIRTAAKTTNRHLHDQSDQEDLNPVASESFKAEGTSFSRAPLNSRLPPVSPHRVTLAPKSRPPHRSQTQTLSPEDDVGLRYSDEEYSDEEQLDEVEQSFREVTERKREGLDKECLEGLSPELQEALIVEDLLMVLMGIEGQYVEFDTAYDPEDEFERLQGAQYMIDPQLDPWLASAVARFLPLATYYTSIQTFISQYSDLSQGVINHALCAALRELIREYLLLLAQLEHQFNTSPSFTLQLLWFYLHPTLHTLSLIHSLTNDLVLLALPPDDDASSSSSQSDSGDDTNGGDDPALRAVLAEMKGAASNIRSSSLSSPATGPAKGGEVLSVISSKLLLTAGDPTAHALYTKLLLRASQPYREFGFGLYG
ncbi:hypothetical protein P7C70_g8967, partial [Phenoliferia sp. Uapishka_3]